MKSYSNLILSVVSLALTTFLLVFVCLAWYSSNTTVHVNGVNGSVVDRSNAVNKLKYYSISEVRETTFVKGEEIKEDNKIYPMPTYGDINNKSTEKILLEMQLNSNVTVNEIQIVSSARQYIDQLTLESNSLSSVIEFYFVTPTATTNEYSIVEGTASMTFAYEENGVYSINSIIKLASIPQDVSSLFFVLGYDNDSIENIYMNNLNNSVLDQANDISYTADFKFHINAEVAV